MFTPNRYFREVKKGEFAFYNTIFIWALKLGLFCLVIFFVRAFYYYNFKPWTHEYKMWEIQMWTFGASFLSGLFFLRILLNQKILFDLMENEEDRLAGRRPSGLKTRNRRFFNQVGDDATDITPLLNSGRPRNAAGEE